VISSRSSGRGVEEIGGYTDLLKEFAGAPESALREGVAVPVAGGHRARTAAAVSKAAYA
jgi:hypothetical protein